MPLSLDIFCTDMNRLAQTIEAPAALMPSCGGPNLGGMHIALSPDGTAYILTYSEKGITDLLVSDAEPDVVMERVFDEVTSRMASDAYAQSQPPADPAMIFVPPSGGPEVWRRKAADLQSQTATIQEALLVRLNPTWRDRQAVRNAKRLRDIDEFFGE